MKLGISFDNDDKNLFLVDDLQLKADAIRHSILPKLEIVLNSAIEVISEVYKTNVFELSTVVRAPQFRNVRKNKITTDYSCSVAGLGAKRDANLWKNIRTIDGRQPAILPFALAFHLDKDGLVFLNRTWARMKPLTNCRAFYDFHKQYETTINAICNKAEVCFVEKMDDFKKFLFVPEIQYLKYLADSQQWDFRYVSKQIKYPISTNEIDALIWQFTEFYPVHESYLQIACGQPLVFEERVEQLKTCIIKNLSLEKTKYQDDEKYNYSIDSLKNAAETKIKVMPAIRWQVFARDDWRCVACGKSSQDGIMLQVDHIIPRSKGGTDSIDNYQTLCNVCNVGKSNKDQTNLRER